jgi:hypothetical protein
MRRPGDSAMSADAFFWSRVNKRGPKQRHMPTRCWSWTGTKTDLGYGQMRVSENKQYAHRFAFELQKRQPIPTGHKVCHRCDYPPCVRGSHLFSGTQAKNMSDMVRKGRAGHGEKPRRGALHPCAKLSDQKVRSIRTSYQGGRVTMAQLAKQYRVDTVTIYNAIHRVTWRHV